MMLHWERAKDYPTLFRRLTGLSVEAFEQLMEVLTKAYPAFERARLQRRDRKRAIGAGGKFKLSLSERVIMTLFFLRHYPTYALLGFLFGLHESNAFRNVEIMKRFLAKHLPLPERIRKERISSLEELLEEEPEISLLIDTTEQERRKPKDREKRKAFYSGRKKRHTFKTQVVVEKGKGLIMDVSPGWEGRRHDMEVFCSSGVKEKFEGIKVEGWMDRGYVGIERVCRWEIRQPKKKPKGRELGEEERERNREINRERVKVEHGILAMKRYQVMGGIYRGREGGYAGMVEVVAGLVNMGRMVMRGERLSAEGR